MPAIRQPNWRLVAVPLAVVWLVLGVLAAYVYGHRLRPLPRISGAEDARRRARGTVRDVSFYSGALNGTHNYLVYLPPHYAQQAARGRRFPVLYLLHGDPGSPNVFISAGALAVREDVLLSSARSGR